MAKIYGLFGAMTGKLADTVMSVRNGEQLARKYQPIVYNPSTAAQVAQRAKLKLMSQLSAIMGPYIAIPRQGSVSSRNLFTKRNFRYTTYAEDQADITLADIQLTVSAVSFSPVSAVRSGNNLTVSHVYDNTVNRVVYVIFKKREDGTLAFYGDHVVDEPGEGSTWEFQFYAPAEECVVYSYGIRDNNDAARAKFGDLQALTAESVAKLLVTRTLTESDVTLTETVATVVPAAA